MLKATVEDDDMQQIIGLEDNNLYTEPYRPQFHYSPPSKWMNDPNGMVYHAGEYHLFYQFHPDGLTWGPMHWGHAVSPDLVHWETLPIALYPDEHGTIFSGCVVIDAHNTAGFGEDAMVAVYSYNTQTQGVAYSTDRGRIWTKYAHNPVIPAMAKDFRDPKVFWHKPTAQWVMVIAAGKEVRIFTSLNLLEWKFESCFTGGSAEGIWEVPDLFPLEIEGQIKWVMLVSVNAGAPAGGSGVQYFIGEFDGQTFVNDDPTRVLWLDYGPDNYAGTTWSNAPDDKKLYIGWMSNWQYASFIPTSPWRGAMTLPREFRLVKTPEGIQLAQSPVKALTSLRTSLGIWNDLEVKGELSLEGVHSRRLEIILEFEPGTAEQFGIDIHSGENGCTRIVYDTVESRLAIHRVDATENGKINAFILTFESAIPIEDCLRLHIFVDDSSVEVFAQEGLVTLTGLTFANPNDDKVVLFAEKGLMLVKRMEIYTLDRIW